MGCYYMEKRFFLVDEKYEGKRLDHFLAGVEKSMSRAMLQKLCRRGYVLIDGDKQLKSGYRLKRGQQVLVYFPPPRSMEARPEAIPLDIVYEDSELLVVNKPQGMVVHPAAGNREGTLVNALLAHCADLSAIGDKIRPGIVHRLDKDTSGLLVVAKNQESFVKLSEQLQERRIKRQYLAIVHGSPAALEGTINAPLGRDPRKRKSFAVSDAGKGRQAVTHYRVLQKCSSYSLLSLRLHTGRTHQIRVHLNYLGCPVVGDSVYGPKRSPYKHLGQLLHSYKLGFVHPKSEEYLEFLVEPGGNFENFWSQVNADDKT